MVHCDYNIDRYVRNRDFDYLKKLPPVTRAAEKFRLETEILDFEIRQTDEIVRVVLIREGILSGQIFRRGTVR